MMLPTLLLAALNFAASSQVWAATQWCNGTIKAIYLTSDGSLSILGSYRNDWTQICNSLTTWKGVDPTLCKQWYALATALRVTGEPVTVYYDDVPSCNAVPSYNLAPAPGYIAINVH